MRFLRNFIIVVVVVFFAGCGGVGPKLKIGVSEQANPWTHLNFYNKHQNIIKNLYVKLPIHSIIRG